MAQVSPGNYQVNMQGLAGRDSQDLGSGRPQAREGRSFIIPGGATHLRGGELEDKYDDVSWGKEKHADWDRKSLFTTLRLPGRMSGITQDGAPGLLDNFRSGPSSYTQAAGDMYRSDLSSDYQSPTTLRDGAMDTQRGVSDSLFSSGVSSAMGRGRGVSEADMGMLDQGHESSGVLDRQRLREDFQRRDADREFSRAGEQDALIGSGASRQYEMDAGNRGNADRLSQRLMADNTARFQDWLAKLKALIGEEVK